jgi:hypothetical protein
MSCHAMPCHVMTMTMMMALPVCMFRLRIIPTTVTYYIPTSPSSVRLIHLIVLSRLNGVMQGQGGYGTATKNVSN